MTFVRELSRACLQKVPGYPGKLWKHSSVQTRFEDGVLVYWATISVYGLDEPYYITGEIVRDGKVLSRGTCEVTAGADIYTTWRFSFVRVHDELQTTLVATDRTEASHPSMAALAEAVRIHGLNL